MLSASPFILPARPFRAAHSAARSEFRSSYFKNTPHFFKIFHAPIAQLVEQSPLKRTVVGSIPTGRTTN